MDLISVVVPMYNAEKHISDTIDSILNQTYINFEIICVDDISSDNTVSIVKSYVKQDNRVKLFRLESKGGASIARNLAISKAEGNYIAFLDADDIWLHDKLEKQLKYMKKYNYDFTYTDYGFISDENKILDKVSKSPKVSTHSSIQKRNRIGCLTVMYDAREIGKVQIPRIDKRNDYALWLKILKRIDKAYLLPEVLSYYRVDENSLSRKDGKINLVKYHYKLHREIQNYGVFKSVYYTLLNILYNLFND